MNILVTGGAGFIGSNFIRYVMNKYQGYHIICLDLLTYAGDINNIGSFADDPNFIFIKGDIADRDGVFNIFSKYKIDVVVNFAAESHVDRSIASSDVFVRTNVVGTHCLLDACVSFGVKRFHQISTDEVYGDLPLERPDLLFEESSILAPSSPYSSTKASADLIAMSYHRTYGLDITISRCSNNYGLYQHREKLIPLVVYNAVNNIPIPVFGDGLSVRDWIYVEDHCKGIYKVITEGKPGEIYNIGANNEINNITLIKYILDRLNKPHSLIKYGEDRKGHDRRYGLNCDKILKELGWTAQSNFYETLDKTIDWYIM